MKRRTFLALASLSAGGLASAIVARRAGLGPDFAPTPKVEPPTPRSLTPGRWRTLEAAQDCLLPSAPRSPGARDVNAIGYLDGVLAEKDVVSADERETIETGADRLDQLAAAHGRPSFADLDLDVQNALLTGFQDEAHADEWFDLVLAFTMEAFLGDPSHGGNPDEIAWRWLDHPPGWPRPTKEHT